MFCLNKECNLEFIPKTSNQIFCSKSCRKKGRFVIECKNCLKKFRNSGPNKKYCSSICKTQASSDKQESFWKNVTLGALKKNGNMNNSSAAQIRSLARKKYLQSDKPNYCMVCKYDYHFDVCHVKDVKSFPDESLISEINHLDNLIALCKNHHWEFDNGKLSLDINGVEFQK